MVGDCCDWGERLDIRMPGIPRRVAAWTRPWVTGRMEERLVVREEPVWRREERWRRSLL